jgi:phosphoglycolate phosphatase
MIFITNKLENGFIMKNIIFDIDGTLWDTTEIVAQAWAHAAEEVGGTAAKITPDILKKEFGKTMKVIADDLFFDADQKTKALLMQRCNINEQNYLEKNTQDLLYPGVKETLPKLAQKCRLFIVSNCQCGYIELFLKQSGLRQYIHDWECFGNTGTEKDETIRILMKRNNLQNAVYVGDTQGDYEASMSAGIDFIHAAYGFGTVASPTKTISNIKDLLHYI